MCMRQTKICNFFLICKRMQSRVRVSNFCPGQAQAPGCGAVCSLSWLELRVLHMYVSPVETYVVQKGLNFDSNLQHTTVGYEI